MQISARMKKNGRSESKAESHNSRIRKKISFVLVLSLFLYLASACQQNSTSKKTGRNNSQQYINIDGFQIPHFMNARKQLEYARSSFTNSQEQKAALEAVIKLFPEAINEVTEANVDLIYFELGDDYRLAPPKLCRAAIVRLENIIRQYPTASQACAKAQWYIGWLYTDLLRNPKQGLVAYKKVVSGYPYEVFYISSPFDSAILDYSENGEKTSETGEKHWWGALALLEIYKHSRLHSDKQRILSEILSKYPVDLSTGYVVYDMITRYPLDDNVLRLAEKYLQINKGNKALSFIIERICGKLKDASSHPAGLLKESSPVIPVKAKTRE